MRRDIIKGWKIDTEMPILKGKKIEHMLMI